MSVEYTIVCDGCGRLIDASGRSVAAARASVRDMGGRTSRPGGKDLCNQCVAEDPPETADAANGVFGNHQRWHVGRNQRHPECRYCAAGS